MRENDTVKEKRGIFEMFCGTGKSRVISTVALSLALDGPILILFPTLILIR
jgi:superfamily II DNA or RNA helicase